MQVMRFSKKYEKFIVPILLLFSLSFIGCLKKTNTVKREGNLGGVFKINLGQQPTTLNALSSTGYYASQVQSYILEGLLESSEFDKLNIEEMAKKQLISLQAQ